LHNIGELDYPLRQYECIPLLDSVVPGAQMSSESQGSMSECQIHLMELDDTHCQPGRVVHKDTK